MGSMDGHQRRTSPEMTIKLWQSIERIGYQTNEEELNKRLKQEMAERMDRIVDTNQLNVMLRNAIEDKLIVQYKTFFGFKCDPNTDRQKTFKDVGNDWYCFECHSCNESELLIECDHCFRAFHMKCIRDEKCDQFSSFQCIYCRNVEQNKDLRINSIEKAFMNRLFAFVIKSLFCFNARLKPYKHIFETFEINNFNKKVSVLVFKYLDLNTINSRIANIAYDCVDQFRNDFQHFVHNYSIVLGLQSNSDQKKKLLNEMQRRFAHEVSELLVCIDCYNYSNNAEFQDRNYSWFGLVCDPPHEVVLAKIGSYPHWPAKVISVSEDGNRYDVRFFDAPKFSRAVVEKKNLKPIDSRRPRSESNHKSRLSQSFELLDKHLENLRAKGLDFSSTIGQSTNKSKNRRNQLNERFGKRLKPMAQTYPKTSTPKRSQSVASDLTSSLSPIMSGSDSPNPSIVSLENNDCLNPMTQMNSKPKDSSTQVLTENRNELNLDLNQPMNGRSIQEMIDLLNKELSDDSVQELTETSAQILNKKSNSKTVRMKLIGMSGNESNEEEVDSGLAETGGQNRSDLNRIFASIDCRLKAMETKAEIDKDLERLKRSLNALKAGIEVQNRKIKRKKWCEVKACGKESVLHCCLWFTYCSEECRLTDWPSHQIVCKQG